MFSFGEKWFYGKSLKLEWWNPFAGCLLEEKRVRKVWVRVLGLPLHMWGKGLFKRLGEECGSFVAIGEDMAECRNSVEIKGRKMPTSLQVVVGSSCFTRQLWWEIPPWRCEVQTLRGCKVEGEGVEGEARPCVFPRVAGE